MNVVPLRTPTITPGGTDLATVIDAAVGSVVPHSVLAVTSKVVALCEGRTADPGQVTKAQLVHREAQRYIPPSESPYGLTLTITRNRLIPAAGIDESNAAGQFVLWPADPQRAADSLRAHLSARCGGEPVGVVITDSTTAPLRRGTTGVCIAASGFAALRSYVGEEDLFGRVLHVTNVNVAEALAAAAVLVMGEGNESTPLALITDVPFVDFQPRNPTDEELAAQLVEPDDDIYAPLLRSAPWHSGEGQA